MVCSTASFCHTNNAGLEYRDDRDGRRPLHSTLQLNVKVDVHRFALLSMIHIVWSSMTALHTDI